MGKIKILIVEDEIVIALDLSDYLEELGYNVVGKATTYTEALDLINSEKPDIVLIDIVLSGSKDGVDLANTINEDYKIPFVFLTSHTDNLTVKRAVDTFPSGYLLKPFEKNNVFTTLEVLKRKLFNEDATPEIYHIKPLKNSLSKNIFVKNGKNYKKIAPDNILWLSSDGNHIDINFEKNKFTIRTTFKNIMTLLSADKFVQVHKSYMVNIEKIDFIESNYLIINKVEIPISRSYRTSFFQKINLIN